MKKIQLLLLALLMALPFSGQAQQTLYGDVNGDLEVNIADVNFVIRAILNGTGTTAATDVNHDGEVNIADINAVIGIILAGESSQDDHDYVDLGLPSGTLWATCNVGASSPEGYGDYFAWGETAPKDYYDWSTYKWCKGRYRTLTKYCIDRYYGNNLFVDNKTELDPEDDAAYVNWGPSWRTPSKEQQDELTEKCTCELSQRNGTNGRLLTGPNGNTLFLPAAGYRGNDTLYDAGSYGYYWLRMLSSYPLHPYCFEFNPWNMYLGNFLRVLGSPVRPVRVSQN